MRQMLRPRQLVSPKGMAHQPEYQPPDQQEEVIPAMTVTLPLILLVAIIVYIAFRFMGLRMWHAIMAAILGFLLAATSAAPAIQNFLNSLTRSINKP
jgi:uncharacterized membrane protein YgcG